MLLLLFYYLEEEMGSIFIPYDFVRYLATSLLMKKQANINDLAWYEKSKKIKRVGIISVSIYR